MPQRIRIALLAAIVLAAAVAQLFAAGSALIAALAGLVLVLGGTALTALISHSGAALVDLWHTIRGGLGTPIQEGADDGLAWFLQAADWYRRGDIRNAETLAARIEGAFLKQGARLVLDGFPRDQINLVLEWQVAEERETLRRPVELARAMAGYAPAFGMLGTLLGLVQMLFGLGSSNLAALGSAMGFAMLTTVYGLILANLILKPIAMKLEQRGRAQLALRVSQHQAVLMLFDRQHSQLIREALTALRPGEGGHPLATSASKAALHLAGAR